MRAQHFPPNLAQPIATYVAVCPTLSRPYPNRVGGSPTAPTPLSPSLPTSDIDAGRKLPNEPNFRRHPESPNEPNSRRHHELPNEPIISPVSPQAMKTVISPEQSQSPANRPYAAASAPRPTTARASPASPPLSPNKPNFPWPPAAGRDRVSIWGHPVVALKTDAVSKSESVCVWSRDSVAPNDSWGTAAVSPTWNTPGPTTGTHSHLCHNRVSMQRISRLRQAATVT